ncbi:hypothetical protein C8J57DRAFT_1530248 [Mycena rebaudengoi]|nr:hypothetical protein C8J57DRAFT_1530248 [Mycena rebaudengoi]
MGARFDVQDDPDILLRTPFYRSPSRSQGENMELTPSETSDLEYSLKESTTKDPPGDLDPNELAHFRILRSMLVLGRDALFATMSVAAQQQADLESSAHADWRLREDTASRINAMHSEVVTNQERIKCVLEDNVRVLHKFGSTEAQLAHIVSATTPIDQALPGRLTNKSPHEYSRRANAVISRKEQSSDAFSAGYAPVPSPATRMARFQDTSISNPGGMRPVPSSRLVGVVRPIGINQGASGYITSQHSSLAMTPDVFKVFALEKEEEIRDLVDLHLANACFHQGFATLSSTTLPSRAARRPRLGFLSNLSVNGGSVTYEFASIICAFHRRFVTSANAQQATKDYEAVRYDPSLGMEHLVNKLTSTAADMCKPPSEFLLRQRFMQLIPAQIHNHMVQRGLFPEISNN